MSRVNTTLLCCDQDYNEFGCGDDCANTDAPFFEKYSYCYSSDQCGGHDVTLNTTMQVFMVADISDSDICVYNFATDVTTSEA